MTLENSGITSQKQPIRTNICHKNENCCDNNVSESQLLVIRTAVSVVNSGEQSVKL